MIAAPDAATAVLDQLFYLANNSGSIWNNLPRMFATLLKSFKKLSSEIPLPENYTLVPSLFVTPSRVILSPHVVVQCSRFTRRFLDKRILLVRFRDEQLQGLRDSSALPRILNLLTDGLRVFGETFWFVAASQSQLRNHSAFFVAGLKSDAESMRNTLLPEPPLETAKFMSRLGLFCTSDSLLYHLIPRCEEEIPDVYNFKHCLLTDGSGFCNETLTDDLRRISNSPHSVAFQIRYRGMKGVVLFSPALPIGEPLLQYRPSMLKCQSDDFSFCLVKAAKFTPLRLNREVITLLLSLRNTQGLVEWDISSVVTDMQEHELDLLAQMLTDPSEAARRLSNYMDSNWVASVVSAGVDLCTEPFWISLLRVVYKRAVRSLRSKTHLPVQYGCMLMGVPDPLSLLRANEISIR